MTLETTYLAFATLIALLCIMGITLEIEDDIKES